MRVCVSLCVCVCVCVTAGPTYTLVTHAACRDGYFRFRLHFSSCRHTPSRGESSLIRSAFIFTYSIRTMSSFEASPHGVLEILPERGLVYSECKERQAILCKPKLLPIKSFSLVRLERLEKKMMQEAKEKRDIDRVERNTAAWNAGPAPGLPLAPKLSPVTRVENRKGVFLALPTGNAEEAVPAMPEKGAPAWEQPAPSPPAPTDAELL